MEIKCPACGSYRIVRFRHDSDWPGLDIHLVNPKTYYNKNDLELLDYGEDIEYMECRECYEIWY